MTAQTGTKLALHTPLAHADARDYDIFRAWQPRSVKLFNYQYSSFDTLKWFYQNLPDSVIVMRDWEMSEQLDNMFQRPEETGISHARDWIAWRDNGRFGQGAWKDVPGFDNDRTVCLGINEPTVRGELARNHPNYAYNVQAVVRYNVAFLDTLKAAGMKGGAMNYSVGWPDNTGTNTRANWENLTPIRDAIVRGNHFLVLHEYFGNNGLEENKGWWVGRSRQCPWDVKIIIGEAGYDKAVYGGPHIGFGGVFNTEQYIAHLRALDTYYKDDPRIHSAQVFLWDYDNNQWHTFSIREIREAFLSYVNSVKTVADTNRAATFPAYPAGVVNPLPPTTGGGVTMIDLWSDHHSSRAGQAVKYVVLHSTASPAGSTLANTAQYLKQNERGVSIHELVGDNTVYRMVADNRAAHHCESETARLPGGEPGYLNNELTWGIEGFQIGTTPVTAAVARLMLDRVVLACRRLGVPSARVISHQEIDPTRRTDPLGINMTQFRAAVAEALGETAPPDNTALKRALLEEAERKIALRFNPSAALQRAIFAGDMDQFTPNSPEFTVTHEGKNYVAQRSENGRGAVRVFYAQVGDWGNVRYVERDAA